MDYRIYWTIYACCVLVYLSSLLLMDDDKWKITWAGSMIVATLVGFAQFLEWVWS